MSDPTIQPPDASREPARAAPPMTDQWCRRRLAPAEVAAVPDTGAFGEVLAASHLLDDGFEVIARNWRVALGGLRGELDVVAFDPRHEQLVVCEVKTRRDAQRFGGALDALTARQRDRIRRLCGVFLAQSRLTYRSVRFDLVAVDLGEGGQLTHVTDAW